MAKKKTLVVKDILSTMYENDKVVCILYAYGIFYASTDNDGMKTVAECLTHMRYDCLNAVVNRISASTIGESNDTYVVIHAEIVH